MGDNDLTFKLIQDIADYSAVHHGYLPKTWNDFTGWGEKNPHINRWKEDELDARFKLEWGKNVNDPQIKIFFRIKNPSKKELETSLNKSLLRSAQSRDHQVN